MAEDAKPRFQKPPPEKEREKDRSVRPTASKGRQPLLKKEIQEFYGTIGMVVSFADMEDGQIIFQNAEPAAESWYNLAQQNPSVRDTWEKILKGSAWSSVILVHTGMAYGIAKHHGLVPDLINPFGQSDNGQPPSEPDDTSPELG